MKMQAMKIFFNAVRLTCLSVLLSTMTSLSHAQADGSAGYRNFPLVISLHFHSLSLPFRDLKANFANVGIGLGTEVSLNGDHNWVQQFNLIWYRNQAVGNGLMTYTQTAWRPTITGDVFTELKLGVGYNFSSRPVESFRYEQGQWHSVGRKGKGMLAIPAGISVGLNPSSTETYVAPFVSYQAMLLTNYSKSIPLVPETLLQIGSRVHFK